MSIYIVKRGDSLYSVGRRFGVSTQELSYANQIAAPDRLTVGRSLVIPDGKTPTREMEVNAYAYPNIAGAALTEVLPTLTYICPFSNRADIEGNIVPLDDAGIVSAAYANGTAPLLTVTNIGASGGFSSDIAHAIFTRQAAQDAFIENMFTLLRQKGYYGVNLNFEYVYPYDRESYNQFLRRVSSLLHERGYFLSSAVAPKVSDDQQGLLYSAHDYAAHGEACDRVVIMTYEWGYTYSAPQAVSPVNRMREVIRYAVTKMPAGKILLGMSNYGYDWRLPWRQGQAARVIGNIAAANLADSVFAEVKFDSTAMAPHFNYTDPAGVRHEVWYEDARSVQARLGLVSEFGLAGISWWTVNYLNRPALYTQQSEFATEKIV